MLLSIIGLMLLVLVLNYFAQNIEQNCYRKLLLILIVILEIPPKNIWSHDLLWFVTVYLTSGYLRLYQFEVPNYTEKEVIGRNWLFCDNVDCFVILSVAM